MKTNVLALLCATGLFFSSCGAKIQPDDPTKFSSSSIMGIWACIASDNLTYDLFTGQTSYHWDYDPDAQTYEVKWYFNLESDSHVQYISTTGDDGEYRKSDGYLHIPANSKWSTDVAANYIFDEKHQAIICPSGKIMGLTLESTKDFLGSDTIFYVKRQSLDEAVIYDNTGWLQSQYVIRVKGIKDDL